MTNETTEPTLYDAVAKLIKAKGRFHTEQNYAGLVKAFDACKPAATAAPELTDAAIAWWRDQSASGWTDAEHLEHPTVNCAGSAEQALAKAVACHLSGAPAQQGEAS